MNKNHKRISAAVLALALGFSTAGAGAFAPVASAQTATQTFNVDSAQINDLDADADVSLIINKYAGLPVADLDTLNGISPLEATFSVQKLDLDLNEISAWQTLEGLTPAVALSDHLDLAFTSQLLTTTGGTATLSTSATAAENETVNADFTMGVYLVTEQDLAGYRTAEPFLVVLPHLDTTGDWVYSQTVSPKNQAISLEKDVQDAGLTLGDEITYTISAAVPGGDLTSLVVTDDLPAELAAATAVEVYTKVDAATPRDGFTLDAVPVLTGGDGNELKITFTSTDLEALQTLRNANPGLEIIVEFRAQIVALPADGVIENHASIDFPDVRFSTEDPDVPDDGAETRLGSMIINNIDADGNTIADPDPAIEDENDAVFEIYRCTTDGDSWAVEGSPIPAIAGTAGASVTTEAELQDYLSANGLAELPTQFTSVNGQVELYGVQMFNFVNGEELTAASSLCALQVTAPAGFEDNDDLQPAVAGAAPFEDYDMMVDVTNLEDADVDITLPATGGAGTLALIAGGLVVAAAGGAAAVRGNRARR